MSLLYTGTKSKQKQKKKPGWKKEAVEYAAWLDKHKPNLKLQQELKNAPNRLELNLRSFLRTTQQVNSVTTPPVNEVKVHDPKVLYKDDPEMAERELRARERKFTAAPIYNKGGNVLITDEMMKDIMSGTTRRR